MSADMPYVTVVIPTYNRVKMLEECLRALSVQSYLKSSYEVVVVNDGSTDGTEAFLEDYSKQAGYTLRHYTQENKDVGAARNLGIRKARGEIICFTDDDCVPDADWIKNLVAPYDDPSVGCVGGEIRAYPPKTACEKYAAAAPLVGQIFMQCGPVVTANTSYRKKVLLEVGGFDEELRTLEDGDLGIRVKLKGYGMVYAKDAVVLHKHRSTLGGMIRQQYRYGVGYIRLHKKYPKNFSPGYSLAFTPFKLAYLLAVFPMRLVSSYGVSDRMYYVAEPLLEAAACGARFVGLLRGWLFGVCYGGKPITEELVFLGEESAGIKLGRAIRRLSGRK